MALLEINLRKPALMEEIVDEDATESTSGTGRLMKPTGRLTKPTGRRGGGSMMRKVAMMGAMVAVAAIARRMRGRRSSKSSEPRGVEVPVENGSSGSGNKSQMRRVAGIVLAVLSAVAAVRRMQGGNRR
jgi:hypothetical protein